MCTNYTQDTHTYTYKHRYLQPIIQASFKALQSTLLYAEQDNPIQGRTWLISPHIVQGYFLYPSIHTHIQIHSIHSQRGKGYYYADWYWQCKGYQIKTTSISLCFKQLGVSIALLNVAFQGYGVWHIGFFRVMGGRIIWV